MSLVEVPRREVAEQLKALDRQYLADRKPLIKAEETAVAKCMTAQSKFEATQHAVGFARRKRAELDSRHDHAKTLLRRELEQSAPVEIEAFRSELRQLEEETRSAPLIRDHRPSGKIDLGTLKPTPAVWTNRKSRDARLQGLYSAMDQAAELRYEDLDPSALAKAIEKIRDAIPIGTELLRIA